MLSQTDRKIITALVSIEGIGRRTIRQLLSYLQKNDFTLAEFWRNPDKVCSDNFRLNERQIEEFVKFKKKYSFNSYFSHIKEKDASIIFAEDEAYPPLLRQIDDHPILLFAKGNLGFVHNLPIAVVGTRQITGYGKMATSKIVGELVKLDAQIISGVMYGVDSFAHKTCFDKGGQTVGVLGYGFDHCYPKSHGKFLSDFIEKGGTLLSEFAPYVLPKQGNFPVRNRIVAGMSLGTIVIEAAKKSGSLITARLAGEYGREVFAVPGPITSPYSDGTRELINLGAKMVGSGFEIVSEIEESWGRINKPSAELRSTINGLRIADYESSNAQRVTHNAQLAFNFNNSLEEKVYKLLQSQSLTTDELCEMVELDFDRLSEALTMMEMEGTIGRDGEGWCLRG